MPPPLTQPGSTAIQLSGKSPDGAPLLAVIVRQTYVYAGNGTLVLATEQSPLVVDPIPAEDAIRELACDHDLYHYKPRTDLVVLGHAYGRGRHKFEAAVAVNGTPAKRILVQGDRECALTRTGEVLFSPPAAVEAVPLRYTHAYGGFDRFPLDQLPPDRRAELTDYARALEKDVEELARWEYPRNPAGCGFLVRPTPDAIARLHLPNLEDPLDPLTPERLAVNEFQDWPRMPLPQSLGWVSFDWFPRRALFRFPVLGRLEAKQLAEIQRGFCPTELLTPGDQAELIFAATNGASLGLQLSYLRGSEAITLENVHPTQSKFTIRLPAERPKIWVDGRKGTLKETDPVLHTVVIEPDEGRITLVWRGAAPALRPYLPQELEKMPFKVEWPSN